MDYLLITFWYATATGFSALVNGQVSHDQVTCSLSENEYIQKTCGKKPKGQFAKTNSNFLRRKNVPRLLKPYA